MGPRYAIYYAPRPEEALWRFGSAIIGYDAETGFDLPSPAITPSRDEWRRFSEEPRRYGFHATLKAPFHLAPGAVEGDS